MKSGSTFPRAIYQGPKMVTIFDLEFLLLEIHSKGTVKDTIKGVFTKIIKPWSLRANKQGQRIDASDRGLCEE